jgi:hypothetical protein
MDTIGDLETRPARRNRTLECGLFVSGEKRDPPVSRRRIAPRPGDSPSAVCDSRLLTTFAASSRVRGMIDLAIPVALSA